MESVALAALTLALGMVVGYECGAKAKKKPRFDFKAPDYNASLYINQKPRTVYMYGHKWTVYGGHDGMGQQQR